MIRSVRSVLRMTPEAIGLLVAAYCLCNGFVFLDWWTQQ